MQKMAHWTFNNVYILGSFFCYLLMLIIAQIFQKRNSKFGGFLQFVICLPSV